VWLKPTSFCPLHILSDSLYSAYIHDIVHKDFFFEKILKLCCIERTFDNSIEEFPHILLLTVANRLDEKVLERFPFELQLSKHIENLATKGFLGFREFSRSLR